MLNVDYLVYPNRTGKGLLDENRGALRVGTVEDNQEMTERGLAGKFAAVTYEQDGAVRFYIFTRTGAGSLFPNVPLWIGPYTACSEEIISEN